MSDWDKYLPQSPFDGPPLSKFLNFLWPPFIKNIFTKTGTKLPTIEFYDENGNKLGGSLGGLSRLGLTGPVNMDENSNNTMRVKVVNTTTRGGVAAEATFSLTVSVGHDSTWYTPLQTVSVPLAASGEQTLDFAVAVPAAEGGKSATALAILKDPNGVELARSSVSLSILSPVIDAAVAISTIPPGPYLEGSTYQISVPVTNNTKSGLGVPLPASLYVYLKVASPTTVYLTPRAIFPLPKTFAAGEKKTSGIGAFTVPVGAGGQTLTITALVAKAPFDLKYDLNGDGVVDSADQALLSQIVAGTVTDPALVAKADFNGDGIISASDIGKLSNYLLYGGAKIKEVTVTMPILSSITYGGGVSFV